MATVSPGSSWTLTDLVAVAEDHVAVGHDLRGVDSGWTARAASAATAGSAAGERALCEYRTGEGDQADSGFFHSDSAIIYRRG